MISALLFALHLVAALVVIDRGLKVMSEADLLTKDTPWVKRRDTAAVCLAWLSLGVGAFISLLAYVFDMQGVERVASWANPLVLTGAAMLLVTEKYRAGKT